MIFEYHEYYPNIIGIMLCDKDNKKFIIINFDTLIYYHQSISSY